MRIALEQRVLDFIGRSRMVSASDRVGIAVSGGADSVALLRVFKSLRFELGITLLVVHFDHMLRGAESDSDARFVKELARTSRLEFVTAREDVGAVAARENWNIEEAARQVRYGFFESVLQERKATRIAVAHTADDQAETLLGHVIRGTGLTGLGGIHPVIQSSSSGAIIRPLLETRRQELREYLNAKGQAWREDVTNLDQTRLRARIRAQLLPQLERDFSPQIVRHLGDLARFAREEESFWAAVIGDRLAKRVESKPGGKNDQENSKLPLSIGATDLLSPCAFEGCSAQLASEANRALTERLIRCLYEKARGDRRELSARHVEQVIRLAAESTSGKHLRLPGNISVTRVFDDIVFERIVEENKLVRETKVEPRPYQYVVTLAERGVATVAVPELATCFRLKIVDWPLAESDTKTDCDVLDAAVLRSPLLLRSWRPGDAYRPRGHRRTRKLTQMFVKERVPSRQRGCWPVLESKGQIVWARGMAPAEGFYAREGTRAGVMIEEESL